MRILITGAAGFLGSALARAHVAAGDQVFALQHEQPLSAELIGRVEHLQGDVCQTNGARWPSVDVLYHCAAFMADHEDEPYARFKRVNVLGTANVLRAAHAAGVERIIHVSTAGVLGFTHGPAIESAPYGKRLTKYERSKMDSERVAHAAIREGLPVTIVRPAQLYGPGMLHLWPRLIQAIAQGKAVILGRGEARVHLTHVDDAVQGIRLAATVPRAVGHVYHIAAESPVSARHMIESIAAACHVQRPRTLPHWPALVAAILVERLPAALKPGLFKVLTVHHVQFFARDRVYSIDKARTELGYHPVVTWDKTIPSIVEWYRREGREPSQRGEQSRVIAESRG